MLSKTETRDLYDRYGHAGLRSGGFQAGHVDFGNLADLFSAFFGDDVLFGGRAGGGRARGADLAATVEIDLVEAAHGVTREVPFEAAVTCAHCGGDGAEPGTEITTCPSCNGTGRLQQVTRSVFGEFVRTQTCPTCAGSGRRIEQPCSECRGAGRVVEERTLEVEIPPGIHHGQRIRLSGEGHAGLAGGRAGDAYVEVRIRPDERFVREGDDIYTTVDLTFTQAALGATSPSRRSTGRRSSSCARDAAGRDRRPPRSRHAACCSGFGRGDQRILVNVLVPRRLTDEQRRLLREFDEHADEDTYGKADEGSSTSSRARSAESGTSSSAASRARAPAPHLPGGRRGARRRVRRLRRRAAARLRRRRGGRRRRGLGGRLARLPPRRPRRPALGRPAVGGAARRRARRRDRPGPRLRHRRASDDAALPRAPAGGRADEPARRRLRLGRALDRRGEARLRAGDGGRPRRGRARGDARERGGERRRGRGRGRAAAGEARGDEHRARRRRADAPELPVERAITSGYLERDEPRVDGWRRVERRVRDGWAADLLELRP